MKMKVGLKFSLALLIVTASSAEAAPILWLDASNAPSLTTVGPAVTGWQNAVGSQTFQPLSSSPLLISNAINGRSAVRFSGLETLRHDGFGGIYADLTFFVVAAPHSNSGNYDAFLSNRIGFNDDYSSGFNLDQSGTGSAAFDRFNIEGIKGGGGGGVQIRTGSDPFNTFKILSLSYGTTAQLYVNGAAEGNRGGNANPVSLDNMLVGGRYYGGLFRSAFDGDIAEIRIYDGVLSDLDRQTVEQELHRKYFEAVPEPATIAALGFGLVLLLRRRRA